MEPKTLYMQTREMQPVEHNMPMDELAMFSAVLRFTSPVVTVEKFAESVGLPENVISAQIYKGYWPTIKIGKRRLINVVALIYQLKDQQQPSH